MGKYLIGVTALALIAAAPPIQPNGETGSDAKVGPADAAASADGHVARDGRQAAKSTDDPDVAQQAAPDIVLHKADRSTLDRRPLRADSRREAGRRMIGVGRVHQAGGHDGADDFVFLHAQSLDVIDGCPPGLAAKNNGCMPVNLAKIRPSAYRGITDKAGWWGTRGQRQGRYRYDDGYLLRMGERGAVAGYIPLLGGALSIGNSWPPNYRVGAMPAHYVDYYSLGPQDGYRYADNVIYRIDPQSSAITSIAALLTGDRFEIGKPIPDGYDIYNVPAGYRARYQDGADGYYRYSDGYVYQVDRVTRRIRAMIPLLV